MRETEKERPCMPQRNPTVEGKYLVDGLEPDPFISQDPNLVYKWSKPLDGQRIKTSPIYTPNFL